MQQTVQASVAGHHHTRALALVGAAVALVAVVVVVALSSSGSNAPSVLTAQSAVPAPRAWDQSAIVHRLGMHANPSGISWTYHGCNVAVVMTTAAQVALYRDAGDPVATNPDGSAGVKVADARTATCVRRLTAALAVLR